MGFNSGATLLTLPICWHSASKMGTARTDVACSTIAGFLRNSSNGNFLSAAWNIPFLIRRSPASQDLGAYGLLLDARREYGAASFLDGQPIVTRSSTRASPATSLHAIQPGANYGLAWQAITQLDGVRFKRAQGPAAYYAALRRRPAIVIGRWAIDQFRPCSITIGGIFKA